MTPLSLGVCKLSVVGARPGVVDAGLLFRRGGVPQRRPPTKGVNEVCIFGRVIENPTHMKVSSIRAGERSFLRANGFTTVLPHTMMGILGHASGKLRCAAPENERFFADSKKPRYELDSHLTSAGRQNIQSAEKLHNYRSGGPRSTRSSP